MPADPTFRMPIEDVFSIRGRGTVVTGRVESGTLSTGDEIFITRGGTATKTVVDGIEAFRKLLTRAQVGDRIGVLIRDVEKQDVARGDVLVGSVG